MRLLRPNIVVTFGATAGQALLGSSFRIGHQRGNVVDWREGLRLVPTIHPSALLRIPDDGDQHEAFKAMVADLQVARDQEPVGDSA